LGISRRATPLLGQAGFHDHQCDLTDEAGVGEVVRLLQKQFQMLDLVVLNAGALGAIGDMRETGLDELRRLMDVNVWANKTLLDELVRAGTELRQVVAISSGAAIVGNRGWNGYAISKAALNMLVQLYAQELPGVHFSAIAPGLVDTAMQDYLCGLEPNENFPSLEGLRSRRKTAEMPGPDELATRLADVISRAPKLIPSGQFLDIRKV
jgi:NAD(P)-dependent dehydrogenase (short-subunit alcohol dehydrogenase family)